MSENDGFITILTFTYSHESAIVRGLLEASGLKTFLKDELIVQVQPFYSNAVGGIKLQVRESDYPKASEILKESGYIPESVTRQPDFYANLEAATSSFPLLNRISVEARMLVIAAAIISIVIAFLHLAILPDTN